MRSQNKPYQAPDEAHLIKYQNEFLRSSNFTFEAKAQTLSVIDPLLKQRNYNLVIAYWIFYLESQRTGLNNNEEKNNKEEKNSALVLHAKKTLNIQDGNICDDETRIIYLVNFAAYSKNVPALEMYYQLTLHYISCLIYEMNLVDSPTEAIRKFGGIPQEYYNLKQKENSGILSSVVRYVRELSPVGHEKDRERQTDFIKIIYQLFARFNQEKKQFDLRRYIDAIATLLIMETELESTSQKPDTKLYGILFNLLGYHKQQGEVPHSKDIPDDIKKIRLTHLSNFFLELNRKDWLMAAAAAGCSTERLAVVLDHYFVNFDIKLTNLIKKKILPRSYPEAVGIQTREAVWKLGKAAVIYSINPFVREAYVFTGLENTTAAIAKGIAQRSQKYFRPLIGYMIKKPIEVVSRTAVGSGMLLGMEYPLTICVNHYLADSEEKSVNNSSGFPQISFTDFIKLCSHEAKQSWNKKKEMFYEAILKIFPMLPEGNQTKFNQRVSLYFVPDTDKGKCPFRAEVIEEFLPKTTYQFQNDINDSQSSSSLPPSGPSSYQQPEPSAPLALGNSFAPKTSALCTFGITTNAEFPSPPPYTPPQKNEEGWEFCDENLAYKPSTQLVPT